MSAFSPLRLSHLLRDGALESAMAAAPLLAGRPFYGPAESLPDEHDYAPRIEGRLPDGLRGTLYRNGPGLFERDGYRKRCILDGDGMIQAFTLDPSAPRYRNRFVRTEKYIEEEAAGSWLYPSWTTRKPGGWWANAMPTFKSAAGVNVFARSTGLYALEDGSYAHKLDPQSLDTEGPHFFGTADAVFSAHPKVDGRNGEWIHFGTEYGRATQLHLSVLDGRDRVLRHRKLPLVGGDYIHDFFVTENFIVLHVHPVALSPFRLLSGLHAFADSLRWEGDRRGTTVWVFDRHDFAKDPVQLEAEASWMWHSANAFEREGEIVADWIGYDYPDHFLDTEKGSLWQVMNGEGWKAAQQPGELRRWTIDRQSWTLREEKVGDLPGSAEFPVVHPKTVCHPHRFVYAASGFNEGDYVLPNAISRVDTETGDTRSFRFPDTYSVGEPVFAAKAGGGEEEGWLLTVAYDDTSQKSSLAVLEAGDLEGGPVASLQLEHHSPLSFHGCFAAAEETN